MEKLGNKISIGDSGKLQHITGILEGHTHTQGWAHAQASMHAQERDGLTFSSLVKFEVLCKQEVKANMELSIAWLNIEDVLPQCAHRATWQRL